jgi:hypothetical protein
LIYSIGSQTFYFDKIKKEEIENSNECKIVMDELHKLIDYQFTYLTDIINSIIKKID